MTRIKICGNTRAQDVALAVELGADLLGFIFTRSRRQISIEDGTALTSNVPESVDRVGVFIDEPSPLIAAAIEACRLTAVQIYRPITAEDRRLGVRLLPAVRMRPGEAVKADGFEASDHPLLDTWNPLSDGGGTGETWTWDRAAELASRYPVIVSGGLNSTNVAEAISRLRPWGVDVSSGVEAEPGKKDPAKLRAFVEAVREADGR
ncbi:MAG: phosphoribosylanthranilate isomerase [Chloroflexi bacterium]|nr:MAG: phosphoribosylanthranilate isomerase [Chloroflexota bacterium]TME45623.1 MAG: phosphoribosylanthranilate isomerase [Chloroflexota bacterium]